MKSLFRYFFFLLFFSSIYAQIPIEKYKEDISDLKSKKEIEKYWADLYKTDQDTLLKLPKDNLIVFDSLSTSLMIRTALMYKVHGKKAHTLNNFTPTLNQAHNYIATASLLLWKIIYERISLRNKGDLLTDVNLGYELEHISSSFYYYSLVGKESRYEDLVEKLNRIDTSETVKRLNTIYENQKKFKILKSNDIIGQWYLQPFSNMKEEGSFEFVKMSDGLIYYKKGGYLQELILIGTIENKKLYRIKGEPFGWYYELSDKNQLTLLDDHKEELIKYTLFD
ncbi:hypothetical protein [Winogradskyella sp. PG-2]|uniref:hypothetical protein n=1 Tax=Winogradskyella sp. PG-2 TaxID=754409 RepID=UPI0004588697|nr:hypothetical protein [Winogradskyella sp. PG-2]BAO76952.1 hypothetical protein WPG_2722 [Winogradskyella sp. PG-2]